jgi:hypothetical protein
MYYVLAEKPQGSTEDLAVIETCPEVPGIRTWLLGKKFDKSILGPLIFDLDDNYPGRFPDFFNETIPLFSDKLLAALHEIGVDNINAYPAVIVDGKDNVVSDKYKAVNIIGVVAAADIAASSIAAGEKPTLIDTSFDSLEIDESKTQGLLIFRLAEYVGAIIIHQKVKDYLVAHGFENLGFIEPKNWMSL